MKSSLTNKLNKASFIKSISLAIFYTPIMEKISIISFGSISPLGNDALFVWDQYLQLTHQLTKTSLGYVGGLSTASEKKIEEIQHQDSKYKSLDKSVLMAIFAARQAFEQSGWKDGDFGINIGSSRGATELFENYYEDFSKSNDHKTHPLTSPTTTLGNLSTWIAHDLRAKGPTISHSITCSTALHAVLNGVAWINAGMSTKFMVGATEAPNTPFTIAQMKAIKIYTDGDGVYPTRALDFSKTKNTMCLGEGAAVFCLEKGIKENALAYIESVGYATEELKHNISISDDAICFQQSMKMAMASVGGEIDVIVMHAPGTLKGDSSEKNAIQAVFKNEIPALTTNKWKIGHTLGASGALSMELALLMLQHQQFIDVPFENQFNQPKKIERIMINAVGFGGNAVSVVLTRNNLKS